MMAVTLMLAGALVAPHGAAYRSADLPSSSDCVQLAEDHASALRPDGTETKAVHGDGLGRRHYFRTMEGGLIPQVTVRPGFDPETASSQELDTFGYPPRPAASRADRPTWDKAWGRKPDTTSSQLAGYCEVHLGLGSGATGTPTPAGASTSWATSADSLANCFNNIHATTGSPSSCYSDKYAGGLVTGVGTTKIDEVSGGWYQSNFHNGHCSNDAYLTWIGIGGFYGHLMQAGTINRFDDSVNGDNYALSPMFWEVVANDSLTAPTYVFKTGDASRTNTTGGDNVHVYVGYGTSGTNGNGHPAGYGEFTVNDTTNTLIGVRTTGWIPSIKDTTGVTHPMSYYYDGTTADYITEVPSGYQLRQPYTNNTQFNFAKANATQISTAMPSENITNIYTHQLQTSAFAGTDTVWQNDASTTYCQ